MTLLFADKALGLYSKKFGPANIKEADQHQMTWNTRKVEKSPFFGKVWLPESDDMHAIALAPD